DSRAAARAAATTPSPGCRVESAGPGSGRRGCGDVTPFRSPRVPHSGCSGKWLCRASRPEMGVSRRARERARRVGREQAWGGALAGAGAEAAALEEAAGAGLAVELPVLDQDVAALHHDLGHAADLPA